jgi:erythritol/L-threitol dehydrogenase
MQGVVCYAPGDYRIESRPDPSPGAGEAVLAVESVGICASDVKCFQGAPVFWGDETRAAYCEAPVVPGHEFVGRIVEISPDAGRRWRVGVGDRVVVEQIVPCGECRYCGRGAYWMCVRNDIFGFHQATHGAMAEYVTLPATSRVHRISDDLAPAHAAFAEPLSCALHGVERADIGLDDTVVIAGAGPIGLGMIAGARLRNPRLLIAVDSDPTRLDVARACGADLTLDFSETDPVAEVRELTDGYGCDVYLDATGHPAAVVQGLTMLCKLGRFVEYSVMRDLVTVDWTIIGDSKELDIRGAHLGPYCWPAAVRLLESGTLPMERIVTHQLPLGDFAIGIDLVAEGRHSIKVTLDPTGLR